MSRCRFAPVYEGDPAVSLSRVRSIARGDSCNVSQLDFGVHSGTHIDAPVHFIDGAAGAETIPLDALMGPAFVADARGATSDLDRALLEQLEIPAGTERLLLRTTNSLLWERRDFSPNFLGVTADGAQYLLDKGVRLLGIDYLSVAPKGDSAPTHRLLLAAGAVILEGLDLRAVEPGRYELCCLPILIAGADGAPARALLSPA
jgi:arylformamidase